MRLKFKRGFKHYATEIDTELLCPESEGYTDVQGDFWWLVNPQYRKYFEAFGYKGPSEAVFEIRDDDVYIQDTSGKWHHAKFLGSDRVGYFCPDLPIAGHLDELYIAVCNGKVVGAMPSAWNNRFLDNVNRGRVIMDVDAMARNAQPSGFPPLPIKRLESTVQSGFKAFSAEASKTTEAVVTMTATLNATADPRDAYMILSPEAREIKCSENEYCECAECDHNADEYERDNACSCDECCANDRHYTENECNPDHCDFCRKYHDLFTENGYLHCECADCEAKVEKDENADSEGNHNNEEGAMEDTEDDDDCGCCPCCGCSCDSDGDEEDY